MVDEEDEIMGGTVPLPAITREEGVLPDFTMVGETVKVFATPEAWATFDAKYPNQDAQTGDPYRRRYPRKNLPYIEIG